MSNIKDRRENEMKLEKIDSGRRDALKWSLALSAGALASRGRSVRAASGATVRVGYQKWGLLVLVKAKGLLEKAFAAENVKVEWAESRRARS